MIHDSRMIGFDTETTGLDVEQDRIVQVGLVDVPNPATPEVRTILVNPRVDIPKEATAVHGITNEQVIAEGHEPGEVIELVTDAIYAGWAVGVPLVIMNAPYDLSLLDREMRRHLDRPLEVAGPVIDVLVLINALTAWKRGHNLERACEHFGVPLPKAHDAGQDALASCRILWRLCTGLYDERNDRMVPVKAVVTPHDRGITVDRHPQPVDETPGNSIMPLTEIPLDWLQRAQERWFYYSVQRFVENQRGKGREPENVNWQWPVIGKIGRVK